MVLWLGCLKMIVIALINITIHSVMRNMEMKGKDLAREEKKEKEEEELRF